MTLLHYLGPPGTFSEVAAQDAGRLIESPVALNPCRSIQGTADTVRNQGGFGVVPYYNLLEGLVQEGIDAIATRSLRIGGLVRLPVVFSAGMQSGVATDEIKTIKSHPKALAQCSEFITEVFPNAVLEATSSTAASVDHAVTDRATACLASTQAIADSPLQLFREDVGNRCYGMTNFTDFLVVSAGDAADLSIGAADTCIVSVTPDGDRVGLLSHVLSLFAMFNINLSKIHSRPAALPGTAGQNPQTFYLEAEIAPTDDVLLKCISVLDAAFCEGPGSTVVHGGFKRPEASGNTEAGENS